MRQIVLACLAVVFLSACTTVTMPSERADLAKADLPTGKGRVVVSAGTQTKCLGLHTLQIAPAGSPYVDAIVSAVSVSTTWNSHYPDHTGYLSVIVMEPGAYIYYPWNLDQTKEALQVPQFEFAVVAGQTTYIGEYWQPTCFGGVIEVRDEFKRDTELLRTLNPAFAGLEMVNRPARPGGVILKK